MKPRYHKKKILIGNFIFGVPDDTLESMRATLDMAKELNCEFANFYAAQGYPGSKLFEETPAKDLPDSWVGYSQHAYETCPLPTATLSSAEVLSFRDWAFQHYFTGKRYLEMVDKKFGVDVVEEIRRMASVKMSRKLLMEGVGEVT